MNTESIVHKVKDVLHALREKLHRESSDIYKNGLNDYEKMRMENRNKVGKKRPQPSQPSSKGGNNRDISAI
ncbi:MAG: hypothetical protein H0V66_11955 [Bdellovibrionales bacterium]|nr:hypothetical protein [Bdellovibrionales bacterium]